MLTSGGNETFFYKKCDFPACESASDSVWAVILGNGRIEKVTVEIHLKNTNL